MIRRRKDKDGLTIEVDCFNIIEPFSNAPFIHLNHSRKLIINIPQYISISIPDHITLLS
jgi:hypothetical protein